MTISFQINSDPPENVCSLEDLEPEDAKALQENSNNPEKESLAGYAEACEIYLSSLADIHKRSIDTESLSDECETIELTDLEDLEDYTLYFDLDLFSSIYDLYCQSGWGCIELIQKKIDLEIKKNSTKKNIWDAIAIFFKFTKNLLAIQIHKEMLHIEKRTSEIVLMNISSSAAQIHTAWTSTFNYSASAPEVKTYKPKNIRDRAEDEYVVVRNRYRAGNQNLIKIYYDNITALLKTKKDYEDFLEEHESIDSSSEEFEILARAEKAYQTQLATSYSQISPWGIVLLNQVSESTSMLEMDYALGDFLFGLHNKLDRVSIPIDPHTSTLSKIFPPLSPEPDYEKILNYKYPEEGLQKALTDSIITYFESNPSLLPLFSLSALDRLLESDDFDKDSFTYPVLFNYMRSLETKIDEIRKSEEDAEDFWRKLSWIAAMLSLASIESIVGAELAAVLTPIAFVADLALIYHAAHSVHKAWSANERLFAEAVATENFISDDIAKLQELGSYKQQILEGAGEMATFELIKKVGATAWPPLRAFLILKSYKDDLDTLADGI